MAPSLYFGGIPLFLTALFCLGTCFLLLSGPLENEIRPLFPGIMPRMEKEAL